jgi:hypothetical protein
MGLTEPVAEALPHAVRAVKEILAQASPDEPNAGSATDLPEKSRHREGRCAGC